MNGLVIGIPRQLMTVRSSELADRLNEESRAERKREDEAHQARLRELEATGEQIKRYGRHAAVTAPPRRLHDVAATHRYGTRHLPPASTSTPTSSASARPSAGGQVIDTAAIYRFRNHGVRPAAASTPTTAAPRTFGAIATRVYGGDAPSFLVTSSARGGAA